MILPGFTVFILVLAVIAYFERDTVFESVFGRKENLIRVAVMVIMAYILTFFLIMPILTGIPGNVPGF